MKNLLPKNWQQPKLANVDTDGKWLMPPIVDLCGRLREPGHQSYGTLASEGRAARQNGILHIVLPPDTNPVLENGSLFKGLREKAYQDGSVYLHILGALTAGLKGEQPANLAGLKQGGAIGVTNARAGFDDDMVMLRTLEYAATCGLKVFFILMSLACLGVAWLMMVILLRFMDWQAFHGLLRPLHCPNSF